MSWKNTAPLPLLGLMILALALSACSGTGQPSLEEQAQSIDKNLICPVCPGETIEQAQVQLARDMRALVREKLREGWSRGQVLQFFSDVYGEDVLASPPKRGFNIIAWAVPPAALIGGAILLALVLAAMRKDNKDQPGASGSDAELAPYLSQVDEELGITRGSEESEKQV